MGRLQRTCVKVLAFGFGGICLMAGTFLIWVYISDAVIGQWGKPDQSLLFWLSILLILAAPLLAAGVSMLVWAWTFNGFR